MGKNKVIKNYLYNTFYQILVLLTPLITTPYVSRVLGPTGVGQYSYTQSIATYFMLIGTVGSSLYGQREIAYAQQDKEKRSAIFFEVIILRVTTTLLALIPYVFIFAQNGRYSFLYQILILEILACGFDISWFFQGMENFKRTVIRNTVVKLLSIMAVFIFVKSSEDVGVYTFCMTAPILIGNISLWFYLPQYIKKTPVSLQQILKHVKPLLILFIPQVATEVYSVLDKTMIGAITSNVDEVAFYTQGQKIIKIILKVVTSLGTVMLPAMSLAFANNEKEKIRRNINNSIRFVYMIGFPMMFGIIGISDQFVPLFYGSGYEKVALLMKVISPIFLLIGTSNVLGVQFLLPTKQQKAYTSSVVGGMFVNLVLNFLLIPRFDSVGASVATVCAELTVTGIQLYWSRNQLPIWNAIIKSYKYLLSSIFMLGGISFIGRYTTAAWSGICIQVFCGIVVYFVMLLFMRDEFLISNIKKRKNS